METLFLTPEGLTGERWHQMKDLHNVIGAIEIVVAVFVIWPVLLAGVKAFAFREPPVFPRLERKVKELKSNRRKAR